MTPKGIVCATIVLLSVCFFYEMFCFIPVLIFFGVAIAAVEGHLKIEFVNQEVDYHVR